MHVRERALTRISQPDPYARIIEAPTYLSTYLSPHILKPSHVRVRAPTPTKTEPSRAHPIWCPHMHTQFEALTRISGHKRSKQRSDIADTPQNLLLSR